MKNVSENKIRVLVVDDSLVSRKLHQKMIADDLRFEVVDTARDGREAVKKVSEHKPDVVSMDVNMPHLNGIEATREIMNTFPVPIIIVSSLYNENEKQLAMEAAAAGAVYIMPKPHGMGHPGFEKDKKKYLRMLKNMAGVKVVSRRGHQSSAIQHKQDKSVKESITSVKREIILMGASAGGPQALKSIIATLPAGFPLPILLVQHLDQNFTESFKTWMESFSKLPVIVPEDGEAIQGGRIYLAPGGKNMVLKAKGRITITDHPLDKAAKPSVSALFNSAEPFYKEKAVATLLSGMGRDGAREMRVLKDSGAYTIAQEKHSCLVFGMPGEAVNINAAKAILTPGEIAVEFNKLIEQKHV